MDPLRGRCALRSQDGATDVGKANLALVLVGPVDDMPL